MNNLFLDARTRRVSLQALGAAALAALGRPLAGDARKKRKKKRSNGDANALCKKQVGQCREFVQANCDEDNLVCQPDSEQCCPIAADCNVAGFLFCLIGSDPSPTGRRDARGASRHMRSAADAKRENKKERRNNSTGKKARKKCGQQGEACNAFIEERCGGDATCLEVSLPCCEFAGTCDYTGMLNCFIPSEE